jgi:hypothetical protein
MRLIACRNGSYAAHSQPADQRTIRSRVRMLTRENYGTRANRRGPDRRGVIVKSHRESSLRQAPARVPRRKILINKAAASSDANAGRLCRCMRRPMCRPIGVCRPMAMRRPVGIRRSLVMRRPIGMMRRSIGMRRRRSICLRRSGNGREDQSCDRHRKYRSNHVVLP